MTRKRTVVGILLLIGLGAGAVLALVMANRGEAVAIVRPRWGTATELVYATGFVEPDQPVSVSSRITAPVTAVYAVEGDRVRRGQPLLRLDDSDLQGTLRQAQAQSLGLSLQERRALTLFAQGWVTRADRDLAVANADAARAATAVAEAKLGQGLVRAGIDGLVIKRDIQPGELATPSRVLMLLGDPARTRVTATIDERDIPRVRVGQPVLLSSDAWPGRIVNGHVRSLTPSGDPNQRAFRAYFAIDRGVELPIGMTLEANIVSKRELHALLVPTTALAQQDLWVAIQGRAHRVPVSIGVSGSDETQVLGGITGREDLIDHPSATLKEGTRVWRRAP